MIGWPKLPEALGKFINGTVLVINDQQVVCITIEQGAIDYLAKPFDPESLNDCWTASF